MSVLSKGATLQDGKYTIIKTLGQGSFGITYLASTSTSLSGQLGDMAVTVYVTIKEFFMSDMNSRSSDGNTIEQTASSLVKNYRRKFIREAENLSHLKHENIVKVLEVFEENNTAYYVMEYIDGGTIDELVRRNQHLTVAQTVALSRQVCAALQYMHANLMLHLDLKPKNIMVTSSGTVKLIDFGLAKQYTESGEPESSTSLGLGTPGYAPIEQANYRQDGSLPVTLDVYAMGATMYKMLTGKVPPESSLVLNDGLPLQPLLQAGVSQEMVDVVTHAMAPIKRDRFQSISELDTALRGVHVEEKTALADLSIPKKKAESTATVIDDSGTPPPYQPVPPVVPPVPPVTPPRPVSPGPNPPQPHLSGLESAIQPKSSGVWKPLAIIASLIAIGIVAGIIYGIATSGDSYDDDHYEIRDYDAAEVEEAAEEATEAVEEVADAAEEAAEEAAEAAPEEDAYILDSYFVTADDLTGLSKWDKEVLRNTIYARHGYRFTRDDLANYFKQFSWYDPWTSDAEAVWNSFNSVEQANVKFIKAHE